MTENLDIGYIFNRLEEIQKQEGYLREALEALSHRPESDSGDPGSPGNIAEQEIAKSIGDIVRCRETTNQKLIEFYGMVYRDLRGCDSRSADTDSAEKKKGSSLADLVSASKALADQVRSGQYGSEFTRRVSDDVAAQAANDIARQVSNGITVQVSGDIASQAGGERKKDA